MTRTRKISEQDIDIVCYLVSKAHRAAAKQLAEEAAPANRFGDPCLHQPFLWKQKLKHELLRRGRSNDDPTRLVDTITTAVKKRKREAADEIQKLRNRREKMGIEKAEQRRRLFQQQRSDNESEREEAFCYEQCIARSRIRLREGRPEAIDVLSIYFVGVECCGGSNFDEPHKVLDEMSVRQLEQLREEIKHRIELAADPQHLNYWNAVLVVCDWKLSELETQINPKLELHKAISYIKSFHSKSDFKKKIEEEEDLLTVSTSTTCDGFGSAFAEECGDLLNLQTPKYLCRVVSGYDWNRYNRVHYDHENPPPKMVRGYKFQILYPNLAAESAPAYIVEKDGNSNETCLLRFRAGSPYEDLVFRIVNRDWEYSTKKGFKCSFQNGVLQLHFNFKRYAYRR